jgi:phosphatidylcholine synthase
VVCAASALYFADRRMKTHDLWFRGFPAIWNVLVFYMLVLRPEPLIATLIVIAAACLMFAPVAFTASATVLNIGTLPSNFWPPLPGVTPPTT